MNSKALALSALALFTAFVSSLSFGAEELSWRVVPPAPPAAGLAIESSGASFSLKAEAGLSSPLECVLDGAVRSSSGWDFQAVVARGGKPPELLLELRDVDGKGLLRIGLSGTPCVDALKDGKWQRLWQHPRWGAKREFKARLVKLGCLLSLGMDGDDCFWTEVPSGLKPDFALLLKAGRKEAFELSCSGTSLKGIEPLGDKPGAPSSGRPLKEALVSYMGWFPGSSYFSPAYLKCPDFAITPVEGAYESQLKLMADYGWTCVLPDTLFQNAGNVGSQCNAMKRAIETIRKAGLAFKAAPMLEILKNSPELIGSGIAHMTYRYGGEPEWSSCSGKPLVVVYDPAKLSAAQWKTASAFAGASGRAPSLCFQQGDLESCLYGTFKKDKLTPYLEVFDGVYNFGASGLERNAVIASNFKKELSKGFPGLAIGAPVWPGYLSVRDDNKNFISPRGTEFFRNVWEDALAAEPDMIHFSTWNDYYENTCLSPSFSVLSSRLEISQRYLCRFFGRPLPEGSPDKPETILSYRKCVYQGEPLKFEFLALPTRRGPDSGSFLVKVSDANGRLLGEAESPSMSFKSEKPLKSWRWECLAPFSRLETRTLKVEAGVKLADGRTIESFNLPDIAVAYPLSYADQLYYSVPLHKMAPAGKGVSLRLNESASPTAPSDGLLSFSFDAKGGAIAVAKNSHPVRYVAPAGIQGAELSPDGPRHCEVKLRQLAEGEADAWADLLPSEGEGEDFFSALVEFPDGAYAYSPTVWSVPSFERQAIAARWLFMQAGPDGEQARTVKGSGYAGFDLKIEGSDPGKRFKRLPGNARCLSFDGKDESFSLPRDIFPNGPLSLECVLRYEPSGRQQCVAYQRGAQASLVIDAKGFLKGWRLPELRQHPSPFVEVSSKEPLTPGVFHELALSFDGRSLRLYVDGELQDSKPCSGSRSCEAFFVGGPPPGGDELLSEIDSLSKDSFFKGDMVRLTLLSRALDAKEAKALYERAALQPFFKASPKR